MNAPLGTMTAADYRQIPEGPPWHQLIDGYLVEDEAPLTTHQIISSNLLLLLLEQCHRPEVGIVLHAPTDVWLSDTDVLQPDILFLSKSRQGLQVAGRIVGAPDFVVEILSPSTATRDRTRKRELYRQHGVREYWIIDPVLRIVAQIAFQPPDADRERSWQEGDFLVPALFPNLRIQVDDVFRNLPRA